MDNPRLLLWIGLALLVWMNIIQWDRDHSAPAQVAGSTVQAPAGAAAAPGSLPTLPSTTATPTAETPSLPATDAPTAAAAAANAPTIRVVTDVIDMDIS